MSATYAAVDLGATSGRVMTGHVDGDRIELREAHRFDNRPVHLGGTLYWDVLSLWREVVEGLRLAGPRLAGIGIDTWGADYGLLEADGRLLANPVNMRDRRTECMPERVAELIDPAELYTVTGAQISSINTIYQWMSARDDWSMQHASAALLTPDLFAYWLTGERRAELTVASSTGLLDVRTRQWSTDVMGRLGMRVDLLAPLVEPGNVRGEVLPEVARQCEIAPTRFFDVASHDTASAVLGVPATCDDFAYISCGTWSLVGLELSAPNTSLEAQAANFTNELGVDGTVRFLRNLTGLWMVTQSLRQWEREGEPHSLVALLGAAADCPPGGPIIDTGRPEFVRGGDVPGMVRAECVRTDQRAPTTAPAVTRCILDSLAAAYADTIRDAMRVTGRSVSVVHIVGGGARNELLAQLTADACGLPVITGPVEAAALGNVLVQARADDTISGDLAAMRARLGPWVLARYEPRR